MYSTSYNRSVNRSSTYIIRFFQHSFLLQNLLFSQGPFTGLTLTTNFMRTSSSMILVFQTYTILTFALTSSAARYANSPATVTAPPSTATLQARAFGDLVLGACGPFDRYVKVSTGANCESLAKANGITIDDLLLMNPMLDKYCDNMIAGHSYCVGALGSEKNGAPPPPPPPPSSPPVSARVNS